MIMMKHAARPWRAALDAALPVLLVATGCTKFASESDAQEGRFLDVMPEWSCLSELAGNPVMQPDGPPLDYTFTARDYISGQTPRNLRGRACFRPDVACSRPATEQFSPDANGVVTLPLNEGFSGYIEITSEDVVPTLMIFPAPLTPDLVEAMSTVPVSLLPLQALLAFGEASNIVLDPGAGVVSINTYNCLGPSASNIRLELNNAAASVPFAFVDGLPIAGQNTTTDEGSAGFANVPPGLAVVRGFMGETTDVVGLETVLVRSQWVTVGSLMPQFAALP